MAYSSRCLRYAVLAFDVLYGVCGVAMLCVGSYLVYRLQEGRGFVPSTVVKPPIILLVLGAAVCLVAGLGWRAAFDKKRWLLILYSVLLVLIVVVELSTAIWGLVLRADIQDDTTVIMEASFSRYAADNVTRSSWDNIHRKLASIALLTLGALIQATITEVTDFMAGKFSVPSIALIIVGSIVFIVAFYGCCGAIRESSCMVTTYVIFLMVILVIEIAIAAIAFIYKDDFEDVFTDAVTKAVNNYYTDKGSRTSMDALQVTLECCGVTGPDDYPGDLPTTCCLANNGLSCQHGKHESLVTYQDGCVTKLQHFVSYSGDMLGGVAIGVSAVTLTGIIFGLILTNAIRNEERRGRY